jgi:hypothetical protein
MVFTGFIQAFLHQKRCDFPGNNFLIASTRVGPYRDARMVIFPVLPCRLTISRQNHISDHYGLFLYVLILCRQKNTAFFSPAGQREKEREPANVHQSSLCRNSPQFRLLSHHRRSPFPSKPHGAKRQGSFGFGSAGHRQQQPKTLTVKAMMGTKRTAGLVAAVSISAALCALLLLVTGRGDSEQVLLQRASQNAGQVALATSIQQALDDEDEVAVHPENTGEEEVVVKHCLAMYFLLLGASCICKCLHTHLAWSVLTHFSHTCLRIHLAFSCKNVCIHIKWPVHTHHTNTTLASFVPTMLLTLRMYQCMQCSHPYGRSRLLTRACRRDN